MGSPPDTPSAARAATPAVRPADIERATDRAIRRLALVSLATAIVAIALYVLTVGTRTGQLVSELILGGRLASVEAIVAAERVLSILSRTSLALGTLGIVAVGLLRRRPRLALAAVALIVGANLTTQLLKSVILDRSDLLDGLFYVLPNSFPSGHATAAASIAVGLILVLPPLLRAPSVVISAVIVAIVGASTLAAGWHRMADAIGGVFVATAWGAGLAAALAWRRRVDVVGPRTAAFGRLSSSLPIAAGVAALALGGIAYLLVALDPLEVLVLLADRGGSPALFWIGILITIGMSLTALGALGYALRDVQLDPRPTLQPEPRGPGSPSREATFER